MLELFVATKLPLRYLLNNFLRRQSEKDARKTPRKVFAFGDPGVRAARKNPLER